MALADILTRILDEAGEEVEKIRARGRAEAEKVLREARKEAGDLKAKLLRKGEADLRREMQKQLSARRLETRKTVLAVKKEILDEVFEALPGRLADRPAGEYAELLLRLVSDDLDGLPASLEVGKEDLESFGPEFPSLVLAGIKRRFPRWDLSAAEASGPFRRGLRVSAGSVIHDLSLDGLAAEARQEMEAEVAQALFSR